MMFFDNLYNWSKTARNFSVALFIIEFCLFFHLHKDFEKLYIPYGRIWISHE